MRIPFFKKLKAVGFDLSGLRDIKFLNFSIHIDRSIHVDLSNASVTINPDRLKGKQKRALKDALRESGLDEAGAILCDRIAPVVDEVRAVLPGMEPTVQYFQNLIPPTDIPLLRACLVLRAKHLNMLPVDNEKAQIIQSFGPRGGHLANLCSAGYLEDWFKPFHEQLIKDHPGDSALVKDLFLSHYQTILSDLPWTMFVSRALRAKIPDIVAEKMSRNLNSGIRHLNIHGLGSDNVKRIVAAITKVHDMNGAVPVQMDRNVEGKRIFVRLELPKE